METDPTDSGRGEGGLDFARAEIAGAGGSEAPACAHCGVPIGDTYFTLGEAIHCPRCHDSVQALLAKGAGLAGCTKAFAFGGVAATLGAGVWAAITHLTGYELGIIAIALGWGVGMAVRLGSGGLGGLAFQALAVALTYLAIVSTYVPLILDTWASTPVEELLGEAMLEEELPADGEYALDGGLEPAMIEGAGAPSAEPVVDVEGADVRDHGALAAAMTGDEPGESVELVGIEIGPAEVAAAFVLAVALPFMMGFENAIGVLIIGIALWEAGRQTRRIRPELGGPFRVGQAGAEGGAATV